MNQGSVEPTRRPIFFRITVGLFALLLLFGAAIVLVVALNFNRIERDGGFGVLFAIFVFVVAMILVCLACAVTSAVSLRRGEAHRRLSMVFLMGSCLVVLTFGTSFVRVGWSQYRQSREAARMPQDPPRRVLGETEIPDSLVEHFRRQGFSIRPALDWGTSREWTLDFADVGPRCEVVMSFRGFARGIPLEAINKRLMEFNAASALNEHAALAMFYPHARGKTSDTRDCEAWAVKSSGIVEPLLDAFRSYRP